jgi:DNA-binding MarR family transcriptional regulator
MGDGKDHTVTTLARRFDKSLSTTSRLVLALVRRRLVARYMNPENRASRLLRLTPAGAAMYSLVDKARTQDLVSVLDELSPRERGDAIRLMKSLATAALRRSEPTNARTRSSRV